MYELFDKAGVDYSQATTKMEADPLKDALRSHEHSRLYEVKKKQELKKVKAAKGTTKSTDIVEKDVAPIKMDRIQTPKFSGKAKDFSSLKQKFCAVLLKGRDDVEMSVLLE